MYKEIYQMKQRGFKIRRIARTLRIPRTKIYKYLERSPRKVSEWLNPQQTKRRKLDQFEMLIHTWLSEYPDLSITEIHELLKEQKADLDVSTSTVGNYVKEVREKYDIPKVGSPKQEA